MGQVRGKIVILQCFTSNQLFGPIFPKSGGHIQDDWIQFTRITLYNKWIKVKDHLDKVNQIASSYGIRPLDLPFYSNWLSGSFVKPYFVASGHKDWGTDGKRQICGLGLGNTKKLFDFPRTKKKNLHGISYRDIYCEGTNVMTYERLKEQKYRFVGLIFADFPGCGLIKAVIDVNDDGHMQSRKYDKHLPDQEPDQEPDQVQDQEPDQVPDEISDQVPDEIPDHIPKLYEPHLHASNALIGYPLYTNDWRRKTIPKR